METEMQADPRFTLTAWEKESVLRLKETCDQQGIEYRSIFELAKYVLVSKSVVEDGSKKADSRRLKDALNRLQNKRAWEERLKLGEIDPVQAFQEIDALHPGYLFCKYPTDTEGHVIVGFNTALAPTEYVATSKRNLAHFFAMYMLWSDLGAADMVEARLGMALLCLIGDIGSLYHAVQLLRLLFSVKDSLNAMHNHRIRKIYAEVPSFVTHLIGPAMVILPKKLSKRLVSSNKMEDLEKFLCESEADHQLTPQQWLDERMAKYDETLKRLSI